MQKKHKLDNEWLLLIRVNLIGNERGGEVNKAQGVTNLKGIIIEVWRNWFHTYLMVEGFNDKINHIIHIYNMYSIYKYTKILEIQRALCVKAFDF